MKILAIGAHPDDIEPQIGGTLAKLSNEGADILTVAATSTSTGASSSITRDDEAEKAAKCLGASFLSLGISQDIFCFQDSIFQYLTIYLKLKNLTWYSQLTLWTVIRNISLFLNVSALHQEKIRFL